MRRNVLSIMILTFLALTLITGEALAKGFSLHRVGNAPEQAGGSVSFTRLDTDNEVDIVKVRVSVDHLPRQSGRVFQVWLINNRYHYAQNLLTFNPDKEGRASATAIHPINTWDFFDRVVVTSEPAHDTDPGLSGPTVLSTGQPSPEGSNSDSLRQPEKFK